MEEDKTKNLPMDEEENKDSLVDYDSDSSVVTVIEKERGSNKTMSKDEEEKENKKETEAKGAIPKRGKPKIIENIDVNREWAENRPVLSIGTKILYEKQENMVEVAHVSLEKEKLKIRRLELEAETKSEVREKLEKPEVRVQKATAEEHKEVKCYRCNKLGHMAKDCPLAGSEAWFCYYCQEIRGHKGDSCPNAGAQTNSFGGKKYTNKTKVSENLLSLRKLADAGFSIYLDDKVFKVHNKLTNKIVFEGIYEKPNWIMQFEVKNNNIEDNESIECAVYRCRAEIVPHCEFPEQSQANIQTSELSISEGELDERDNVGSAIGRENEGELTNVNENIEHNNAELDQVIKLEDIQTLENIEEMCESSVIEKVKKLEKINEAMLWHVRLGHASLNYLRQLQKVEKRLETVKFDNSILECEVCIMARMAKLPFKKNRNRAQRPLQIGESILTKDERRVWRGFREIPHAKSLREVRLEKYWIEKR
ncbi:uncharacterized protein LOC143895353 [Temnothorax americanus]|uniref:uncharacterized protein LOC143895353 n=1 Tax=Temnothorax americanus TaxID=1964332 RepID=UPI0040688CA4